MMEHFFLSASILMVAIGLICILAETEAGVVYYVLPTEPLSSCTGNSSCPFGQLCHTLDYLAEHSSECFSPDQVNMTLMFMCGVHNYTKDLAIKNLYSFVMKGAVESKANVIINHHFLIQPGQPSCTTIQFFNISFVKIKNLTLRCPSINLIESLITVKSSNLYGYPGIVEGLLSFINITGRGSQALLDNCTFKENCFIVSNFSDGITVRNSIFQSYKNGFNSIIKVISSIITLTGNVNFTDSIAQVPGHIHSSNTAVFLSSTHQDVKSALNITAGAIVYFVNLTCNAKGAAVSGENAMIQIGGKARVVFMHNRAHSGGAVYLKKGAITIGVNSTVIFAYNHVVYGGGAIFVAYGTLNIDTDVNITFSYNSAGYRGGAIKLEYGKMTINTNLKFSNNFGLRGGAVYLEHNSSVHVDTNTIHFFNNTGIWGGAMYFVYSTMYINFNKSVEFIRNTAQVQGGAIYIESNLFSSIIAGNSAKLFLFNNSAFQGGALYIIPSLLVIKVGHRSSVQFLNNIAFDVGGAVYAEMQSAVSCLYVITDYSAEISFKGNRAQFGVGHHMYGTSVRSDRCDHNHMLQYLLNELSKRYCIHRNDKYDKHNIINISFDPGLNETLSPVSSAPKRVCLCDSNGKPQCANVSHIFSDISVYRGETFTLSAYVVGYDFGTTTGMIHAGFLNSNCFTQLGHPQDYQFVNNSEVCTNLVYRVLTKCGTEMLQLQASVVPVPVKEEHTLSEYKDIINHKIADYISHDNGCLGNDLLTTPVFINITLLPGCPPGLTLTHDDTTCSCYPALVNIKCSIQNKTGFLQWNSTMWVNATFNESHSTGIIYNRFCPLNYCKSGNKTVNIGDDPSKQCTPNRTGILCGACSENFSLAIGSSRCIECPNSHNVSLLLAFGAAGVFLVFFILALNLTVTQGLINGVIFYANIVWAYKIILLPSEIQENHFLQVFIAWLNLDFGIETCFFVGLDAYWKTWLQFLFPFYIWAIAGVIIVACRYSSRLTNLIGSRAVPLLATLFLLSYMKLLHTVIDATSVAMIAHYPQNTSYAVWYLDGNLRYCQHPHIFLFIAAIATLVFLWLPYTLLLLFIQPLRRVSHLRPFKWINKLAPVYDAYFSLLKDKHQYWFGTMLLVRGILLVLLTVTSVANPELNVFVLFLFTAFLFFLISIKNVYKGLIVRILESATLLNLIVLSAGTLYKWESTVSKTILLKVSIGIIFAQFCVVLVLSLIKACLSASWRCRRNQDHDVIDQNIESDDDIAHERIEDPELEPLINFTPRPITLSASAKYSTATKVSS